MSKALVIKGANFTVNKVETVTIGDSVPCTAVELSESSISLSTLNETEELTAILTPANTTDTLSWESSDEDVVTVENGVVTCVGVGTATITATCGEQSATCSVTATISVNMNDTYHQENETIRYSGSIDLANNKDWIGLSNTSLSGRRMYYSEDDLLGGYRAFVGAVNAGKYLMPIPAGTNHIHITAPSDFTWISIILADSKTRSQFGGVDGDCSSAVSAPINNTGHSDALDTDISSYPTANGFILSLAGATNPGSITDDVIITFSKVNNAE